ncbi:polysaccharide biosynthesis protein [Paenibacillus pinistramenti]|uniref:polysaccharide biosynthesis protein n=1 Tax=Paenibacillus pinistramenti TaxID=1768003 RepID=UPI001108AF52|nr:nucleoside-diphosphate sugar epimerase/dehydratase [Paenibacillus pinistramenti]
MVGRSARKSILVVTDMIIVLTGIWSAYFFRFGGEISDSYLSQMYVFLAIGTIGYSLFMIKFRLYNRIWQYASIGELVSLFKAVLLGSVFSYMLVLLSNKKAVPLSVIIHTFETVLLMTGLTRLIWRLIGDNYEHRRKGRRNTLLIGAGSCGTMVAKEMKHNSSSRMYPSAFIDDNRAKHGSSIQGVQVIGGRDKIVEAVEKYKIEDIVICMPSASRKEISEVIKISKSTSASIKIVPQIHDLIEGKVALEKIRDVNIEDLLGREPVKVDLKGIAEYVSRKMVLVTGAGGSIGSEICRQIAAYEPEKLILLGHGENSIYKIEQELRRKHPGLAVQPVIADIKERGAIEQVFREYGPQVIFHAAAHKHVPLMEKNPAEAIRNNVFGTKNIAECAHQFHAEKFVLISTDKAVNPTSIMGATKRIAETIVQSLGANSETRFVVVRFGNVLGSRGSVVPAFKQQIAEGGPVTVTHPEMTRYFMTIPEAVNLVIQAGSYAKGGEIYILDMKEPVKIVKLAEDLISLSGYKPYEDIEIVFTGMRPGEKLYEELLLDEEELSTTLHNRIRVGRPVKTTMDELKLNLLRLEKCLEQPAEDIVTVISSIVPTYIGFQNQPLHPEAQDDPSQIGRMSVPLYHQKRPAKDMAIAK